MARLLLLLLLAFFFYCCSPSSFTVARLLLLPLLAVPPPKLVVTPSRRLYTRQYNHQTRLNSNLGWNEPATEMRSSREAHTTRSISRKTCHQTCLNQS